MKEESVNAITEDATSGEKSDRRKKSLTRWIVHILYMIFNGACLSVYGYQIYLWVKQSAWTKIPSRLLMFTGADHPLSGHNGVTWNIITWMLDVELAYTLCFIAMIFYGLRWLADRRAS